MDFGLRYSMDLYVACWNKNNIAILCLCLLYLL